MEALRDLKQLVELEILVTPDPWRAPYDVDQIKPLAIELLQASGCHKDCVCNYGCGCAETNECSRCNPPKRLLRLKTCPQSIMEQGSGEISMVPGICLEEIEVSPLRVRSKK